MPDGSIIELTIFSHGLRGLVALRHGWDSVGWADYGLDLSDVSAIDPKKFAPNPTIEFDSCNSGVPCARGGSEHRPGPGQPPLHAGWGMDG